MTRPKNAQEFTSNSLKVLLLQAREPDDLCLLEERESFSLRSGLRADQLVPHSVLDGPPTMDQVRAHDAVFVGGSGDYFVSKNHLPHQAEFFWLLAEIAETGHPMFASCFGFQCLVQALGGTIIHDPDHTEVGTFDLQLTEPGFSDPVLGTLPAKFDAQMGRKDRATQLPDGATHLASSELCPYQALRWRNQPVWATQFHPELDHLTNRQRFDNYAAGYQTAMTDEELQASYDSYRPSPQTEQLLAVFLREVFG